MKNIYNQRLLRFADHLANIKNHPEKGIIETIFFVELEKSLNITHKVMYNYWVFEELPACFDEWFYEERFGNPTWEDAVDNEGTIPSVIVFFDLTHDEFAHLFDINGANYSSRFGGEKISENSDGPEFAENIITLIKSRK